MDMDKIRKLVMEMDEETELIYLDEIIKKRVTRFYENKKTTN